jgi:hypothetical protein
MTVTDCYGKEVKEDFKELGALDAKKKGWAEWLLDIKLTPTGGGMGGYRALEMKRGERGFKKFEKDWRAWWEEIGSKRHAESVKKARKVFNENYVLHNDRYVQREELETTLTKDEIRWLKLLYKAHKSGR